MLDILIFFIRLLLNRIKQKMEEIFLTELVQERSVTCMPVTALFICLIIE